MCQGILDHMWSHVPGNLFTSPFSKGGLRGILKILPNPPLQKEGIETFFIPANAGGIQILFIVMSSVARHLVFFKTSHPDTSG